MEEELLGAGEAAKGWKDDEESTWDEVDDNNVAADGNELEEELKEVGSAGRSEDEDDAALTWAVELPFITEGSMALTKVIPERRLDSVLSMVEPAAASKPAEGLTADAVDVAVESAKIRAKVLSAAGLNSF